MKKKLLIISVFILIMFIIILSCCNNKKIFKKDGILYALTLDEVSINSFPSKGMYRVDVNCENATGKWDYDNWKLYIEDITNNVSCDIDFTTISKTYLNSKIIGLSGQTQGTGQVVNENGYRYEGRNPNNYIWFNNELWRIIGVFDSESHGQNGQNLVKIIRVNSLESLVWDKSSSSDWSASSLKNLLNGAYYNATDGTSSGYCYGYKNTILKTCDYREIGINDAFRSMVKNVLWYINGYSGNTVEEVYDFERNGNSGSILSVSGYIGLMYPSDYGYSVLASSCARTTSLGSYNTSTCAGQSWMYFSDYEWTISKSVSTDSYVAYIPPSGRVSSNVSYSSNILRPVLYLNSDVYVVDGNGTMSDPYIVLN